MISSTVTDVTITGKITISAEFGPFAVIDLSMLSPDTLTEIIEIGFEAVLIKQTEQRVADSFVIHATTL